MAWKIGTTIRPCEVEGKCGSELPKGKGPRFYLISICVKGNTGLIVELQIGTIHPFE
jgi:hypothetical protein